MIKKLFLCLIPLCFLLVACSGESGGTSGDLTATLTIDCSTVWANTDLIAAEKLEILPEDGIIYQNTNAAFSEGESAFDLLKRELTENKIHFDFEQLSSLGSSYIKGIGNLYSMDCGEFSGWFYKVNGEFPEAGSESYILTQGDVVEFLYTCDFGGDIGMIYEE